MMIPTKRDEKGRIHYDVSDDISILFDPDDTWVDFRNPGNPPTTVTVSEIDRLIECLQRIKRMASE